MNVDLAYVLGVYMSDGSAHRHAGNWIVSLTAIDKDFLEETLRAIEEVTDKTNTPIYPQDRDGRREMWKFSVYNKELVLLLWDFTDHKRRIPASILFGSIAEKLSFVAGVLDGDGFVSHSKNGQYQVGIVNTGDWAKDQLPGLLQSLGVKVTSVKTSWPNTQFNANKPIHKVHINVRSFVASGGYSKIARKHERLESYYEQHKDEFTDADKQRRYKRLKLVSPSETIGSYRAMPE